MKKGFTLLELIIVVIVLAILASLAIPRFIRVSARATAAEALQNLGMIRGSLSRYYARGETYSGAVLASGATCGGAAYNLDMECPNDVPGADFDYALTVGGLGQTYTITATKLAPPAAGDTITIDQDGTITGTGAYLGL